MATRARVTESALSLEKDHELKTEMISALSSICGLLVVVAMRDIVFVTDLV